MPEIDFLKVITIIPARGGSKGVVRKNARMLGDFSLLQRAIQQALEAKMTGTIVVTTEDDELYAQACKYEEVIVLRRPAALATDGARSIDVVVHVLDSLGAKGRVFDAVCLLQPTSPFRVPTKIDEAIRLLDDTSVETVLSVVAVPHQYNPAWVFVGVDGQRLEQAVPGPLITRRQELPSAWIRDGAVYVNRISSLRQNQSFVSAPIGYIENACSASINIDTLEDWEAAETYIACLGRSNDVKSSV